MTTINHTTTLGQFSIQRLGLGTMRLTTGTGIWGDPKDKAQAIRLIQQAVERGVNFIDTADSYGPYTSELIVEEALRPFGDQVLLATKGGAMKYRPGAILANGHPYYLRKAVEGSLIRLRREVLDLYFLHRVDPNIPIEESVGALSQLQAEGKIRHIGISNVSMEQYQRARAVATIDAVQNAYSHQDRRHEALVQQTLEDGVLFVAHTPVARNQWQPDQLALAAAQGQSIHQLALSWLLEQAPHIVAIPGTSSLAHLEDNLSAYPTALPQH